MLFQRLLEYVGVAPERVQVRWISGSEGQKFAAAVGELAPGWGCEVGLAVDALRAGFRVVEVPVAMSHRATGRRPGGFLHRLRQGLDIGRALLPRLVQRPP